MLEKLESSIFILGKLNHKIQDSYNHLIECDCTHNNLGKQQQMFYYNMEYGMILVCSFRDEYRLHFSKLLKQYSPKKNSDELLRVLGNVSSEIEKHFPDLKKFRNNYLAHNMRITEADNVFLNGGLRKFRVPQNMHDYHTLITCISIMYDIITSQFPDAYKNFDLKQFESSMEVPFRTPLHESAESEKRYIEGLFQKVELLLETSTLDLK